MPTTTQASVRMLAFLHAYRRDRGLPASVAVTVPAEGFTAAALAESLELPLDRIEGLFLNARLVGLEAIVHPGDRVAFLPHGTPATHPAFFGRTGIEAPAPV
ncbi:MAG: MoaD/ThiS family protein [Coriobacteriia bacterium]|nr:MoaD/ThiS family protein [Coriobacteriia bacterium]